jgi:flagellin
VRTLPGRKLQFLPHPAEDFTQEYRRFRIFVSGEDKESCTVSLRINTNLPALHALRNFDARSVEYGNSIARLSSGLRINNAGDDPAGLTISEGLRSQIRGLSQALRNSQDAVNMSKTAEGALSEVQSLLRNVRALAVHSANTAVVDAMTLQANQTEIRSVIQSIDRVAQQTQFGNKRLLDGTAGVSANITSASEVASIYLGGTFDGFNVVNGPITLERVTQAQRATAALDRTFTSASSTLPAGTVVLNGYSLTTDGSETLQGFVSRLNQASSSTGVSAEIVGTPASLTVHLRQVTFGSQHRLELFDAGGLLNSSPSVMTTGTDAVFDVTASTNIGPRTVRFVGGRGPGESGLRLSDRDGNSVLLTPTGNAGFGTPAQAGIATAGAVRFQVGANSDEMVQFSMPSVYSKALGIGVVPGMSLADIDVSTAQGAQDAIRIIDEAVRRVAQLRGEIGSFQKNFLESTVRSLDVAKENLTATESTIRDANMAEEIAENTRLQMLQQAGISMMAQANQSPQNVLQLLRG